MSITPSVVSSNPSPTLKRVPRPARSSSATFTHHCSDSKPDHARSSSALGRIADAREPIDLPRRRRIKSAVTNDSRIMTVSADNSPWCSNVWGETSYSNDYPPKKLAVHPKQRPVSATRMNNPHPSQMFLQWRIPTRIHPHSRSVQVDPIFLRDTQEKFYQDYSADNNNTRGAMHEVPITNVAKIPFPGNTVIGLKVTGSKMSVGSKPIVPIAPIIQSQEQILQKTLQPTSYMAYQQWIHEASEEEKRVLAKLLKAALVNDSGMKRALSDVFSKDSLKHIREWMQGADENELSIAVKVIEQLSMRSQKFGRSRSTKNHSHSHHCSKRLHRSRSWTKQTLPPACSGFGVQGMKLRPHSADKCFDCSISDTGSIYNAIKSNKFSSQTPSKPIVLWNHKIKPPQASKLLNRGALFGIPHKERGQHFDIHPEWPTA